MSRSLRVSCIFARAWPILGLLAVAAPHSAGLAADAPSEAGEHSAGDEPAGAIVAGTITYQPDPRRPWRYGRYYIAQRATGELAEAVVCLDGPSLKNFPAPKEPSELVLDQKDFRFVPETAAIRAGDRIRFTNSDPQAHNVSSGSLVHRFDFTIAAMQEHTEVFPKAGGIRRPLILGCKFHSVMRGWIFIFPHSLYAVTQADGRYRLAGVPPGDYTLHIAHPAGGLKTSRRLTVTAMQAPLTEDVALGPDQMR